MRKLLLWILPAVLLSSCDFSMNHTLEGNANIQNEQRQVAGFATIEVSGPFQVTVVQGSTYAVSVEADENLLEYIEVVKEGNALEIREKDKYNLRGTKGLRVTVQMPEISGLSIAGSGTISCTSTLSSKGKIEMEIAGSGKIQAELDAPQLDLEIAGSGTATLSGKTRTMDVNISGSGDCVSEALKSENCEVSISGSGTAKIYASQKLDVSISGSGDVYYAGNPQISKSIAGSGKVREL